MNYTVEKRTNSKSLILHVPMGLGNKARAQLACSKADRFKLLYADEKAESLSIETRLFEVDDVQSLINQFETLFSNAQMELVEANTLFEALQTWREYLYGLKKKEG